MNRWLYLKSYNDAMNVPLAAARQARSRLARLGFLVSELRVQTVPRSAGPNEQPPLSAWLSEAEIEQLGIPETEPVYCYFFFAGSGDGHEVARVAQLLGPANDLSDVQRLCGMLRPGDRFAWVEHLFGLPGIAEAVNRALAG